MNNKSKFDFFERVRIFPKNSYMFNKKKHFSNTEGTVLAKGLEEDNKWGYDVSVDKDRGHVWGFKEHELESLGAFAKREDYYPGDTIKVVAAPNQKGDLVGILKEDYAKLKKK